MYKTEDNLLNPVLAWAHTVQRLLRSIPSASGDTKVCEFWSGEKIIHIDASMVRSKLRAIVELIGEEELGFRKDEVGLHSIRSGGAMAMFLSGVNVIIIQRVGRWLSQAFLEYIRDQVDSFTMGVSQKMLHYEKFHHLNAKEFEKDQGVEGETSDDHATKGDGSTHVPHTVHFSTAVTKGENNLSPRRV